MKTTIEKYFCDLCDKEVMDGNHLVNLRLAGYGVAESEKDICWDCITSFVEWKQSRISKRQEETA